MLHRIFVAINLPEAVKTELLSLTEEWRDPPEGEASLPCKWTKKENLHITLVFYGGASGKELEEIKTTTREIAGKHKAFSLKLSKIMYGPLPLRLGQAPQMVWAIGESTKELLNLQKDLAKALRMDSVPKLGPESHFTLHLTIARLNTFAFNRIDPTERPDVEKEISISFPVNSIEIMESTLKPKGATYSIIESIKL